MYKDLEYIKVKYWINYVHTWLIIKRKQLGKHFFHSNDNQYNKFAVVCQPRTGSNWLHTLLNSHSQIFSYGEVLRRAVNNKKTQTILNLKKLVFGPHQKQIKAVGLKIFYEYSKNTNYKKIYQGIVDDESILIIHLVRRDVLGQYLSLLKAEKSKQWSNSRALNRTKPVRINVDEFKLYTKEHLDLKNKISGAFKDHQVLEVSYEDLVDDLDNTLLKIQLFLQVKPRYLFSMLQKQSISNIKEQIINWKDLKELM